MNSFSIETNDIGLYAVPLTIDGVGTGGALPPDAPVNGAIIRIPMWPNPSVIPGNVDLIEIMILEPGASEADEEIFHSERLPVPVTVPDFFTLPPRYLQRDGDIRLRYRITAEDTDNPDTSLPQWYVVSRVIPVNLLEPQFPSATFHGYLNCMSVPKVWEKLLIKVPAQPGRFAENDVVTLDWEGFQSLNGVRPIGGTAGRFSKTLTLAEADSIDGFLFELTSQHYAKYIEPMARDASAIATYTLHRNSTALGKSEIGLVKLDRVRPGKSDYCGPVTNASGFFESNNALEPRTSSLQSRGYLSGNNVNYPTNGISMECMNMNMQTKFGAGVLALPPTVVGNLPDGRLTYEQLVVNKRLTVLLTDIDDKSPDGAAKIELYLFPRGTVPVEFDPTYVVMTKTKAQEPGGDWTFPIEFEFDIPARVREVFNANGDYTPFELSFFIYDAFENPDSSSPHTDILLDQTAPYQRQPGGPNGTGVRPTLLTLGTGFPAVIDDAWLLDPNNSGGLSLTIPTAYQKFEANNDKVNFYISTQTTFTLMQGEGAAVADFPLPTGGVINVPLSYLSAMGEGAYFYSYNLEDLPGNISNNSLITTLFRRIKTPAPELGIPRIPVTGANGSIAITLSTAADPTKVIMEIDFPKNSLPGDRIIPQLTSDQAGAPITLPEQQIPPAGTAGPLRFEMDFDTMSQLFGDANGTQEVEFEYWYELERSTITPNPISQRVFAIVDFSYAGPEQPNLPDLPNINIVPVVVQGAGTPAPAPNTLGPAQAGIAATMTWPLWTDVNRPITGREIVKFYYQGKQVGEPIAVRVGATEVSTILPWETIRLEGNGTGANARQAYITIEFPGSANVMMQRTPTDVQVTAIVINVPAPQIIVSAFLSPGGAIVPERVVTSINCPSLNHPVAVNGPMPPYRPRNLRVRILRDANIPTGAMVELTFVGRTTNTPAGTDIPNTTITDSAPMPATGNLEFRLDNYEAIKTIQLPSTVPNTRPTTRYARIAYTVNGLTSELIVPVALLNSSLVYCDDERREVVAP
ncbi:hypothetical protein [Pseudomonas sp. Irchel 3E19]|uniref:hypothetical protein n=1 Tax=Pseudomonas sp. Irchel 3E19 TaxID=2008981 RepID=UPI000BA46D69|nr:hypothetical protein [Pseudomonas sp. Irchel 3E19]